MEDGMQGACIMIHLLGLRHGWQENISIAVNK